MPPALASIIHPLRYKTFTPVVRAMYYSTPTVNATFFIYHLIRVFLCLAMNSSNMYVPSLASLHFAIAQLGKEFAFIGTKKKEHELPVLTLHELCS